MEKFHDEYGKYTMESFEFEYGRILEDVEVEYCTRGTPKYDEEGYITNAIVYCHQFNGNYSSIDEFYKLTNEGGVFDKNDYFYISVTSLGFPNSCSPSSTDLKHKFPKYSILDRVNFKRQFIKEKFKIKKFLGIVGRGVGGYETYTWACEYPDEMEFIIIMASSYKTNGYRYVTSKIMDSIIDSCDDFYNEVYSESLSRIMVSINRVLYSNHFSKKMFQTMSNDEIDVFMDDFVDEGLFLDVYDFKFRNDSVLEYNVENQLSNIKSKVLIISTNEDIYYSPEFDVEPLRDLIDNPEIIYYDYLTDYDGLEDYSKIESKLKSFMDQFKK